MYLQEQKLSLPAGGGDTLQVLLNSQGSASPLFDPPPSSVSEQVEDLALLYQYAGVVSMLLVEKKGGTAKSPNVQHCLHAMQEQTLRSGSQSEG